MTGDGHRMQLTFYLNIFTHHRPLLVGITAALQQEVGYSSTAWPLELLKRFCRGGRLCAAAGRERERGCCCNT